jgi:polysaccharide biosynthesis/export protein
MLSNCGNRWASSTGLRVVGYDKAVTTLSEGLRVLVQKLFVRLCAVYGHAWCMVFSLMVLMPGSVVVAADTVPATTVAQAPVSQVPASDAPAIPAGAASSETQSNYIIQVFVWRNPELTVSVPVRPDGRVSTPLVEDMVAVGKTPTQLARDIETRLADYIRSPQVSIIVNNAVSTYSQVKVIGQVRTPQSLPYREGMTVLDVMLAVGGLTEFASGNRTRIIRTDIGGKETSIKVRAEDLVLEGKVSENKSLKPGDVIIVPESVF